ncbi:MAG: bifunctional glutamate N-acetyltransferase/amino-acid acetyltransferase ArgJ [Candidatus Nanopelagicales bacterium]
MSVTSPRGFLAAGVSAGIKSSGARDVAVIVNAGVSAVAAAVFTSNRFAAAPVLWSRQVIADHEARAVVINSGGANACTGPGGFADTHQTAEHAAQLLQNKGHDWGAGEILVCSTGLIGERLPMQALLAGVGQAIDDLGPQGGAMAAQAIMTTDSVAKETVIRADGFSVGGMAKGAGMLAPGLATMIVVLTTDAVVDAELANTTLRRATAHTFDRIDSDGCMSTNDTVVLMCSGESARRPDPIEFARAVHDACADLARQLIADAEGASKDICINVQRASTEEQAVDVARSVSRSNLLKCAIHGEDPNWGRVLSAIGVTTAAFNPGEVDVAMNGVWVCRNGAVGDSRDGVDMSDRVVTIDINLRAGEGAATVWTNDLTADYVHENSAYSS